jgi:high-affinity Fe2+/Pb2+ permease
MPASAVVVFRETLEAALIVAIVMGASRGVLARGHWIAGGGERGELGRERRGLHVLIGYQDRPTGVQALFYAVTLASIAVLTRIAGMRARANPSPAKPDLREESCR